VKPPGGGGGGRPRAARARARRAAGPDALGDDETRSRDCTDFWSFIHCISRIFGPKVSRGVDRQRIARRPDNCLAGQNCHRGGLPRRPNAPPRRTCASPTTMDLTRNHRRHDDHGTMHRLPWMCSMRGRTTNRVVRPDVATFGESVGTCWPPLGVWGQKPRKGRVWACYRPRERMGTCREPGCARGDVAVPGARVGVLSTGYQAGAIRCACCPVRGSPCSPAVRCCAPLQAVRW